MIPVNYKNDLLKTNIQYIITDKSGKIVYSDDVIYILDKNKAINGVHPFFETILPLLNQENKQFEFSSVNLDINNDTRTLDVLLKTFANGKNPLLTIIDLTSHYSKYRAIMQSRNVSVISNEYAELKNAYLKQQEAFKDIFISNFSRNLRDPISGILTFSNLLSKTNISQEQRDYLEVIKSSSNYLKQLINDILDISKIQAGKLDFDLKQTNVNQLLQEVSLTQGIKAENKGIVLIEEFDKNLPLEIETDPFRLKQVLNSLIDNAIKFTETGHVKFKVSLNQVRAHKANINFEISDTGAGIDRHKIKTIFDYSEFAYNTNNDKDSGSIGLGLFIVKHLVDKMKGKIEVDSELNKGSKFSINMQFKIPLKSQIAPKADKIIPRKSKGNNQKYNVLLADTSDLIQVTVLKVLANDGNFYVDIVMNIDELLKKLSLSDFDIVLIDSDLPGFELVKDIKRIRSSSQKTDQTGFVLLSGEIQEREIKMKKYTGIDDIIIKPFNPDSLLDKIYLNIKK